MTQLTALEIQLRHRRCRLANCPICKEQPFPSMVDGLRRLGLTVENFNDDSPRGFASVTVREDEETCSRLLGCGHPQSSASTSRPPLHNSINKTLMNSISDMNQELIRSENTTSENQETGPCIHETFEMQVRETPNAIAVQFEDATLSYRELNERANQLAHFLKACGVGPEVPVALYLERSLEMVVAITAVLKAGGVYVPVDLAYPQERFAFMLEDTRAPVIITIERLRPSLPPMARGVLCLDSLSGEISRERTDNLACETTGENAAYIIYTSGSTGRPKGVVVTHNNVVRLLTQTEHWYGFNAIDVWTLFHSYAFDVSVWEIWGALFYGGRLVVVPHLVTRNPGAFYELLAKENVTVLCQTPSAFRQLIWAETIAERRYALSLRYVICAGEALELQSLKSWFERHGDERPLVVNMYGITETTVHSMYRSIRATDLSSGVSSPIGVPIPDLQIHLLDENLKPVPPATPGEICVGGAGVARGYLNRPELTSQRFVPDPFSSRPGAKLYRSGDLARISESGEMEYLGRMDHQVKIRGFRVELGEIESALNQHPAIRESVVIAHDVAGGDKRLVAYVVPSGNAPTVTELREHLRPKLPDYMIPAVFTFLDSMPLTANGKLDRRALPAPDCFRPRLKDEFVAARNDREDALAGIWSGVLEINQVGIHDNFFELGGDSIRAIRVLAQAKQSGLNFSLQQLFQNPTVAGLAALPTSEEKNSELCRTAPFSLLSAQDKAALPADVEDAYPLAQLQLGMFFHNELNPASAIYHDVFSFQIQCEFNREKLEETVQRLAARHPILRTFFHIGGFSEPLQLVHRSVRVPFTFEDLRSLDTDDQKQRILNWIESEKRKPFDRTTAPLIRFHAQLLDEKSFQLIVSFHHACVDGWSLAVIITEVLQDYVGLLRGTDGCITPPQVCYRDFVALEKQAIGSEESRRFWSQKVEDASAHMLPRWPKSVCAGGQEQVRGPEIHIEPDVLAGLRRLAQLAGVPFKAVLVAAHQRVMSFLYGHEDVTSGLICNGRPESVDGEKLIGLFLNTLPLRLRLKNAISWLGLVKETFAAEQEIIPHRRVPLAEIQKLNGGQPLFETGFDFVHFHIYNSLQNHSDIRFAEGPYFEANNLATYTLFTLDATSTRLEMHIDYDPNLLCRQQIEEISGYYVNVLKSMAANPLERCDTFSPLSQREREKRLVEWNSTDRDFPRDKCVHQLFEARAAEHPDADAVVFGNQRLTYGDLNGRANQVARKLVELNAVPDGLVGICIERSLEMVVGLLAVLKAGAAYVPLDPVFPTERLAQMISDAQLPIILTQQKLANALPASSAKLLMVDAEVVQGSAENVFTTVSSENLAYVIYTSGSTGKPKGVQIAHRSVVNLLNSIAQTCSITAADNLLAVTTISFDIAALEIFLPLILGGKVTLASREESSDGAQLSALLESSAATVMQATPATWRLLIEAGWQGRKTLKILCGGEALTRKLADDLLSRVAEVWNVYGPTETTIWSTAWKVRPDGPISIGRPLANTQIYILDRKLQLVPVGVAGELHISGEGLAREYLNRPELTERVFIENPFGDDADSRLYRTGDLARYLPDGTIECLGRLDRQVKVRGYRIELGEIEAALRQHPTVREALVTAQENGLGEKRLAAYLLPSNGAIQSDEIRGFVGSKLPLYMIPAHFIALDAFPLTPNGKIDVRRLPKPEAVCESSAVYAPPQNDDEKRLVEIWNEVLELERIGMHDNVFHLGCDSLLATRAFVRINVSFRTNITLGGIFEHPTIAAQAQIISKVKGMAASPIIPRRRRAAQIPPDEGLAARVDSDDSSHFNAVTAIVDSTDQPGYQPLSSSQLRLWLAEQIKPGTSLYNIGRLLVLKGPLEISALTRALNEIARRHEILRTIYSEGLPGQKVLPQMELDLPFADLASTPAAKRRSAALALARAAVAQPFNLAEGPLFRAELIRTESDEHLLVLAFHQIVTDAWSYRVFCNELATLYSALVSGTDCSLSPLPIQYADYAVWQQQSLARGTLEKQLDYWQQKLSPPLPRLMLSAESDHAKVSDDSAVQSLTLEGTLLETLRRFNGQEGVTTFTTLLAAYKLLLHHWTGETDLIVGSPEFGRRLMEAENLLGHFVNILVLRTRISADHSFREILAAVRQTSLEAVANADVPFETLFEKLPSNGQSGARRFFQVWFGPIDSTTPFQAGELSVQPEMIFAPQAQSDLSLFVSETQQKISLHFEYKRDLFPQQHIAQAICQFERLLERVILFPRVPVRELLIGVEPLQASSHGVATRANR